MKLLDTIAKKYHNSIQVKLLFCVWITSTIATFIFTASQTYMEFKEDKKTTIKQIETIKNSYAPSLGNSVWYLDNNLIHSQLKGILNLKNISFVEVTENGNKKYSFGKQRKGSYQEVIELSFNNTKVGLLTVYIDIDSIFEAYIYKTVRIFLAQAFKAFLVSWIILVFFKKVITGHLESANKQLKVNKSSEDLNEIVLNRKGSNDELDQLISAFNSANKSAFTSNMRFKDLNKNLEQKINDRTIFLQEANQKLRKAQKSLVAQEKLASLGMLSAGIAHEIKNPINLINNSALIIEDTINHSIPKELSKLTGSFDSKEKTNLNYELETLKEMAQIIISSGNRADKVVSGMLMQSRTGKAELLETDLESLINAQLKLSFYSAKVRCQIDCKITKSFGDFNMIYIYPQDFSSTLTNIFDNAFYAISERTKREDENYRGELSIITEMVNDEMVIKIKDNGIGIPTELKDKVIDPFFTTKPTGSGTGLGLSMAFDIVVEEHQGSFDILSKEGQFTEFILTIPMNLDILQAPAKEA